MGKVKCLVENLDRWGADEIYIQSIDRSRDNRGPDYELLEKIGKIGLGTPLIYGGGIRNKQDANEVIHLAADRITVDSLLYDNMESVREISEHLGQQAVIASLPIASDNKILEKFNYKTKNKSEITDNYISSIKPLISEILCIDYQSEGKKNSFNMNLPKLFSRFEIPLIIFGGISEIQQIENLITKENVKAIACGNFLHYSELKIPKIKESINVNHLRTPDYDLRYQDEDE